MFQPVEPSVNLPALETEIGRLWKEQGVYDKSLAQRAGAPRFVFYEGPPTANGMPHPGHCLTRAVKDLFPRYKTMRGYLCERKAGWDTHGLPVEVEVCKELGIHSKEEIEEYGVEPFIQKCQQSVWRYMQEWERLTDRLGFWIHQDEAYVTYHQSYVESVWWSLKNFFDRGLLYQGHKIVWWWAQGGTALSAGEVGQGYREVADPSVYVKFPLLDDNGNKTDTSLLVWTTTPWTLPSNQFVAVHPELDYSVVIDNHDDTTTQRLIIASDLVETIAGKVKRELQIVSSCKGTELIGRRYQPPFDEFYFSPVPLGTTLGELTDDLKTGGEQHVAWRVVAANFVTTESGSGIVHQAPAFGEVDFEVLVAEQQRFVANEGPELINAVAPNGTFTDEAPEFCQGRWVKDCDKDITRDLRDRGLLFHQEQYLHDYPFCWRAEEDPLIQYPRESWFIRTTEFKDQMLENNSQINWLPEHIKDGRFGNFLEANVDWALSRERYWGTPLPIWVCQESGKQEAVSSYEELLAKQGVAGTEVWEKAKAANPELPDDLRVHKPYIDAVTYDSPFAKRARMKRVSEVIDCWYDSGAMPFAQWGYQGQTDGPIAKKFQEQFPADFISEALDQTRGWFYSQLAISTMLFGEECKMEDVKIDDVKGTSTISTSHIKHPSYPHPFRNCIVLGLMNAEWWQSKDGKTQFLTEEEAKASGVKFNHKVGKMSKSLRNYRSPQEIFDVHGADALRWYFFANQAPWTSIIYSEKAIKESVPEFLLRLWNVYSFFVIYANIDEFDPSRECEMSDVSIDDVTESSSIATSHIKHASGLDAAVLATGESWRPPSERAELHQWILSELNRMCRDVTAQMDAYDNYGACQSIIQFVDALSNWYVRRSRERFWSADKRSPEKLDCYWTLYECLLTTSKLIAPFTPFFAESLWQNLAVANFGERTKESVHLCDFPTGDESLIDDELASHMALGREISSLGRSARMNAKLKVRQPLSKVEIILVNPEDREFLEPHNDLICEELNVKQVEYTQEADHYISYTVLPNFKRLGPRLGKNIPVVKKMLAAADGAELLHALQSTGKITLDLPGGDSIDLDEEDIEVRLKAKEGWAAAQGKQCVVVLATELTEELIAEGFARDVVRFIQDKRKELNLEYTDRISLSVIVSNEIHKQYVLSNSEYIIQETLASCLGCELHHTKEGDKELALAGEKEYNPIGFSFQGESVEFNIAKEE